MFTGIITHLGEVASLAPSKEGAKDGAEQALELLVPEDFTRELAVGASVSCNGCCLTLKAPPRRAETGHRHRLAFGLSPETLARTTLGRLAPGAPVNLERAARLGDELGGHFVTGHIDGLAELESLQEHGENRDLAFRHDPALSPLIAAKGSLALDGVSLTVNRAEEGRFAVMLIAHTLAHTTLGRLAPGAPVNLEIDLLARYIARQAQHLAPPR